MMALLLSASQLQLPRGEELHRLQTIRLNGIVAFEFDATANAQNANANAAPATHDVQSALLLGKACATGHAVDVRHGERALLRLAGTATTERLGVVGPITVQWTRAHPADHTRVVSTVVTVAVASAVHTEGAHGTVLDDAKVLARAVLPGNTSSWHCAECTSLVPHTSYILRVALVGAEGIAHSHATVRFRAGPHGPAGLANHTGGWPSHWVGGARTVKGTEHISIQTSLPLFFFLKNTMYYK